MDPAGTPKAENIVEKEIRGVFPTPDSSLQRREMESARAGAQVPGPSGKEDWKEDWRQNCLQGGPQSTQ